MRSCAPSAPPEAAALVDALLSADPADRPTAVEVLERLGVAAPAIQEAVADTVEAAERSTAMFAAPRGDDRRSSPRVSIRPASVAAQPADGLVVAGIAAAAGLAFVGATIANADRVVEVPRVTGMTVPQARAAVADAAHVDAARRHRSLSAVPTRSRSRPGA